MQLRPVEITLTESQCLQLFLHPDIWPLLRRHAADWSLDYWDAIWHLRLTGALWCHMRPHVQCRRAYGHQHHS